jgi:hypothetical protein
MFLPGPGPDVLIPDVLKAKRRTKGKNPYDHWGGTRTDRAKYAAQWETHTHAVALRDAEESSRYCCSPGKLIIIANDKDLPLWANHAIDQCQPYCYPRASPIPNFAFRIDLSSDFAALERQNYQSQIVKYLIAPRRPRETFPHVR